MRKPHFFYSAVATAAIAGIALVAFPQIARSRQPIMRCGTYTPTASEILRSETLLQRALANNPELQTSGVNQQVVTKTINVYFHVITASNGVDGNLTDAQIKAQIDILNKGFAGEEVSPDPNYSFGPAAKTPYVFVLKKIDRTANDNWFTGNDEYGMKSALRVGVAKDLNVYSCNLGAFGLLGYATFPQWYASDKKSDGVVIAFDSLPGFPGPFGLGKTLTHETGHWVGLYHTFQDSCSKHNDFVADTPAEGYPFWGDWFPVTDPSQLRDTCTDPPKRKPVFPGVDPAENYMDYSNDISYYRFTPGQVARMTAVCKAYRGL